MRWRSASIRAAATFSENTTNPIAPMARIDNSHRPTNARVRMVTDGLLRDDVLDLLAEGERVKRLGHIAGGAEAEAALDFGFL